MLSKISYRLSENQNRCIFLKRNPPQLVAATVSLLSDWVHFVRKWLSSECAENKSMPYASQRPSRWTSRRTAKRSVTSTAVISGNQVCAVGWQRLYVAFSARLPRATRRSGCMIARRRTNLARKISSRAHFVWPCVRCARARCAREHYYKGKFVFFWRTK